MGTLRHHIPMNKSVTINWYYIDHTDAFIYVGAQLLEWQTRTGTVHITRALGGSIF